MLLYKIFWNILKNIKEVLLFLLYKVISFNKEFWIINKNLRDLEIFVVVYDREVIINSVF